MKYEENETITVLRHKDLLSLRFGLVNLRSHQYPAPDADPHQPRQGRFPGCPLSAAAHPGGSECHPTATVHCTPASRAGGARASD